jgi:hypothetical protein
MLKAAGTLPIKADNINLAVKRPSANIKEAENAGEQANAAAARYTQGMRFSKHGTFAQPAGTHPLEQSFKGLGEGNEG